LGEADYIILLNASIYMRFREYNQEEPSMVKHTNGPWHCIY